MANLDNYTVYRIQTCETFLKSSKPKTKAVAIWFNESMESLKSCLLITDWGMFHDQDISIEEITDWIYFCTDDVIAKKEF